MLHLKKIKSNHKSNLLLLLPLQEREQDPLLLKAWKMNPNGFGDSLIGSLSLKPTSTIDLIILILDLITLKGEWTMWSMIFISFKLSITSHVLGLLLCHPLKEMIMIVLLSHLPCYFLVYFFSSFMFLFYVSYLYLYFMYEFHSSILMHFLSLFYFNKGGEYSWLTL